MIKPDIAVVTDENRILLGFETSENLDRAERTARRNNAHCYLLRDGWFEDIKDKIGQQVKFGFYWRFEHDEIDVSPVQRGQRSLWPDLYSPN